MTQNSYHRQELTRITLQMIRLGNISEGNCSLSCSSGDTWEHPKAPSSSEHPCPLLCHLQQCLEDTAAFPVTTGGPSLMHLLLRNVSWLPQKRLGQGEGRRWVARGCHTWGKRSRLASSGHAGPCRLSFCTMSAHSLTHF